MKTAYTAALLGLFLIGGAVFYTLAKPVEKTSTTPVVQVQAEEIPKDLPLLETRWIWLHTELPRDGLLSTPNREQYVLSLSGTSTMGSTTDCNTLGGIFSRTEEKISFSSLTANQKACKDSLETTYAKELRAVSSYRIIGSRMYLMMEDGGRMVFEQK